MAKELLKANKTVRGLDFDPRTKLLLLLTMAVFVLGGMGGERMEYFRLGLSFIPFLLLLSSRKWKTALLMAGIYGIGYVMRFSLLPYASGLLNFLLVAVSGIVMRFIPSIMMGYFVVSTTTVSEFTAAMERMHISNKIVIPMSVIFRFFPTIGEEFSAINDAMRMRGVRFGGGKVIAMLEYRVVPMITSSVRIGDELSAAALTRGLGGPGRRTNICRIGFHFPDIVVIAACLITFCVGILAMLGIA